MNNYDGDYLRKELRIPLDARPIEPGTNTIKVQAHAPGYVDNREGRSHHVSIPAHIYKAMLATVPVEGQPKPLPQTFDSGIVVTAVRVEHQPGLKKHRALIIRQYQDSYAHETFRTMHSVHWIGSDTVDGAWDGWQGKYDYTSFTDAFVELERRLTNENVLSPF